MTLQLRRRRERFECIERKPQLTFIKKAMDGAMTVTTDPDAARTHLLQRESPLVGRAPMVAPRDQMMKLQRQGAGTQGAGLDRRRHAITP